MHELKDNLQWARNRMKARADMKRRELEFQIGDFVYVKLQPYRQHSVALRTNQKLSMRYFGPFKVLDRIGKVAYKLELPPTAKIHPVFHISVLKKCIGAPTTTTIPTPLLIDDIGVQLHPQLVLGHRMIKKNDRWHEEVLIKWQSLPSEEAT